jgi:alkaline phosphatase D
MHKLYTHRLFFLILIFSSNQLISDEYKVAFGSCLDQKLPQPIWSSIENENIDSFIFLGDNVYGDSPNGKLNKMKLAYKKQKKMIPNWLNEKDIFYIWDDHDYGVNDGGTEYELKEEAQRLYLDFWGSSQNDKRRSQEGTYFNNILNIDGLKVNIIGLDTRYFRSTTKSRKGNYEPIDKNNITMLGENQWLWLSDVISQKADLIILLSSVQVLPTSHSWEKWNIFPSERTKLLNLLEKEETKTIILSGDRHKAGFYEYGELFEISSSSLNKAIKKIFKEPKEYDPLQIGEMVLNVNYGLLKIDTKQKLVVSEIKNIDGETVLKKVVKF